jgi:peptidyl-dipeptidase A
MEALKTPAVEMALRLAIDEWERRLEEADEAYADTQWRNHLGYTNGDDLSRVEAARADVLLDNSMREILHRWEGKFRDPLLARRVALLLQRSRQAEIESQRQVYGLRNRIDRTIINFHPRVVGRSCSRVERSEILCRHPDRDRRQEAWMAMAPLAANIEDSVRQLMRQRQNLARKQGYDGFVAWALDRIGLSREGVEGFFEELLRATDALYGDWLVKVEQRLAVRDGLRPWDLAYAAEQGLPLLKTGFPRGGLLPAVQAVADGLGLGEAVAGVQVHVADIPYAALCYAVHPPGDVRILVSPRGGQGRYNVLFHEFGHAVHWRSLQPASWVLRWDAPPFNEAMACLWERLASEPDWLVECVLPRQVVDYRQQWARRHLYRLRVLMARTVFEYRAYEALDSDLLALLQDVFTEYLGVPYDEVPGWADSPFWTSHPVYLQNYVVGEAVASQTLAALRRQHGRLIGEPHVGAWLVEHYYAAGASLPWMEKVARATGAPWGAADLVADLCARAATT